MREYEAINVNKVLTMLKIIRFVLVKIWIILSQLFKTKDSFRCMNVVDFRWLRTGYQQGKRIMVIVIWIHTLLYFEWVRQHFINFSLFLFSLFLHIWVKDFYSDNSSVVHQREGSFAIFFFPLGFKIISRAWSHTRWTTTPRPLSFLFNVIN